MSCVSSGLSGSPVEAMLLQFAPPLDPPVCEENRHGILRMSSLDVTYCGPLISRLRRFFAQPLLPESASLSRSASGSSIVGTSNYLAARGTPSRVGSSSSLAGMPGSPELAERTNLLASPLPADWEISVGMATLIVPMPDALDEGLTVVASVRMLSSR